MSPSHPRAGRAVQDSAVWGGGTLLSLEAWSWQTVAARDQARKCLLELPKYMKYSPNGISLGRCTGWRISPRLRCAKQCTSVFRASADPTHRVDAAAARKKAIFGYNILIDRLEVSSMMSKLDSERELQFQEQLHIAVSGGQSTVAGGIMLSTHSRAAKGGYERRGLPQSSPLPCSTSASGSAHVASACGGLGSGSVMQGKSDRADGVLDRTPLGRVANRSIHGHATNSGNCGEDKYDDSSICPADEFLHVGAASSGVI
ncbi:hypothetical protein OBBRIDRAFT_801512 [Obba rivulosa]|uniref:Uncharacterized protein n=1 Tax=Obba rivulosa TaxID=1052685 RepID=A0A8E2J3I7_9APHY|nr:hypothetical protein OBBRIDRAFT_801512 [Obba rivulosa]